MIPCPDILVVGAGLCGSVIARHFADLGRQVLILEKRNHIAGNMYDYIDERCGGLLLQKYGPHTFHTKDLRLYEYIKQYSLWDFYKLYSQAMIDGDFTPCPFNFKTIDQYYEPEKAKQLKKCLREYYNDAPFVTVVDLAHSKNGLIREFAAFLFEKDYRPYTSKQWGKPPESIDINVLKRVPVRLSYDAGYFDDIIQVMPRGGFTKFIENILKHKNISIELEMDAIKRIKILNKKVYFDEKVFKNTMVYTGAIDELLAYKHGALPYRSLRFEWEKKNTSSFQPAAVCAYPMAMDYTRITEYTKLPYQGDGSFTVIAKEYSSQYDAKKDMEPYYPMMNDDSLALYEKYVNEIKTVSNLCLCGRLADYKYYNMDQALARALEVCKIVDR
ncbi:MAG: UDP-galactopyranose mutase [Lachnospiraceae bacterium]|nr:UDP-galactopyranose mutase [Lachnospiraceae bacterium]